MDNDKTKVFFPPGVTVVNSLMVVNVLKWRFQRKKKGYSVFHCGSDIIKNFWTVSGVRGKVNTTDVVRE